MRRCREVTSEDPKAKHYVDILMSSVEYDTFVKLMRIMRPVAAQRAALKADMKDTGGEGGSAKGGDAPSSAAKAAKGESSRYDEEDAGGPRSPSTRAEGKFSEDGDMDRSPAGGAKAGAK